MKSIIILGLLLNGLMAWAQGSPAGSAWDLIISQHASGHDVTFASVEGTYVGRCYEHASHELAVGSALGFYTFTSNDGPLLPAKVKKVIYGLATGSAPDGLDNSPKDYLDSSLFPLARNYTPTKESPIAFVITQPTALDVHLVQNGAYLYLLARAQKDIPAVGLLKGDIFNACYYFIKK